MPEQEQHTPGPWRWVRNVQGNIAEEAANDLAIIIAAHEVVNRRRIGDTYATRLHLEEMVRVLTITAEAAP